MSSKGEAERVSRELLARVVGGAYPPGVRLPAETELATQLGCGRSTIREALTRLSSMGVVASRRGSGAHVPEWRKEGTPALLPLYLMQTAGSGQARPVIEELLGMRRLLAREAVRLAVRHASEEALHDVRKMFEATLGVDDPVAHVALELEVFRGLVIASAMWPAVWLANSFWGPVRDLHQVFAPVAGGPPPDYAQAMKRVLDLVEARKEAEAMRHVDHYLERVDRGLLAKLDGATSPSEPKKRVRRAPTSARRP